MWKCSSCGRENERNFCTNCQCPREASESVSQEPASEQLVPQEPVSEQPVSQEAASEQLVSQETASEQLVPQEPVSEQPVSQEAASEQHVPQEPLEQPVSQKPALEQLVPQEPVSEQSMFQEGMWEKDRIGSDEKSTVALEENTAVNSEKESGKKGCIAAIVVVAVIISLIAGLIFAAVNLLISSFERDGEREVMIEIIPGEELLGNEVPMGESLFNFDIWDSPVVQIQLEGVVLDVPMPPNAVIREDTGDNSVIFDGENFLHIQVLLDYMMESDFRVYSDFEVANTIDWINDWNVVLDYQVYEVIDATLMVTHWGDGFSNGFTFTKISQYQGALLLIDIEIENPKGLEDFFEAYGFVDSFGETLRSIIDNILNEETNTT